MLCELSWGPSPSLNSQSLSMFSLNFRRQCLVFEEGQESNYFEDYHLKEFIVIDTSNPEYDQFTAFNNNELFKLDTVSNVGAMVKKAKGEKCSRCWKILSNPCGRGNCGLKN